MCLGCMELVLHGIGNMVACGLHGSMVALTWLHGSMAAWKYCMVAPCMEACCMVVSWKHGCMVAWKHGCMVARKHDCLVAWVMVAGTPGKVA